MSFIYDKSSQKLPGIECAQRAQQSHTCTQLLWSDVEQFDILERKREIVPTFDSKFRKHNIPGIFIDRRLCIES